MVEAQLMDRATTSADLALAGATRTLGARAAALFANPAGLQGAGSKILLGLGLSSPNTAYTDEGHRSRDLASPRPLGYAVGTLPLWRRRIVAALAYQRRAPAFTRHAPAPDENNASPLRFLGRSASWDEHEISLALAFSFRWVAIGASLSAARVALEFERTLFAGIEEDSSFLGTRHYDADLDANLAGLALSGRLGLTLTPWWWMRAALTIDLPQRLWLAGELTFTDPSSTTGSIVNLALHGGNAEASLQLPWRLGAGVALRISRRLRLFFEVELLMGGERGALRSSQARWSTNGREVSIEELDLLPKAKLTSNWRLATEFSLWGDLLLLRGGWAYAHGGHDAAGLGALLLDARHHELGAGLVLRGHSIQLSLGIKHLFAAALRPPTGGFTVVAPLDESGAMTSPAGEIDFSRTQLALEIEVAL